MLATPESSKDADLVPVRTLRYENDVFCQSRAMLAR